MVPCVKCPIAFDILALYALTNFIDELGFKVTCTVGWIQYNSEGVVELCGCGAAGGPGERSCCVGKGPWEDCRGRSSSWHSWQSSVVQLCKFSVEFYLFWNQNDAVLLSWKPFALMALSWIPSESRGHYQCSFKLFHECDCVMGALVLHPSGQRTFQRGSDWAVML